AQTIAVRTVRSPFADAHLHAGTSEQVQDISIAKLVGVPAQPEYARPPEPHRAHAEVNHAAFVAHRLRLARRLGVADDADERRVAIAVDAIGFDKDRELGPGHGEADQAAGRDQGISKGRRRDAAPAFGGDVHRGVPIGLEVSGLALLALPRPASFALRLGNLRDRLSRKIVLHIRSCADNHDLGAIELWRRNCDSAGGGGFAGAWCRVRVKWHSVILW